MTLDYAMTFSVLCDGTDSEGERLCSHTTITPRLMFDMSPNKRFGIVYELGNFLTGNDKLRRMCEDHMNSSWWRIADYDPMEDLDFVAQHSWHWTTLRESTAMITGILLVVAAAMMIIHRVFELKSRKKRLTEFVEEGCYGAV